MNYLAHLYLADCAGSSLIGNLMGDFVRGRLDGRFAARIEHGIRLHRRVDSFTDRHPAVRRSRHRLPAAWRRHAGIMVDVFYDHFLAREWEAYHPESLEAFAARVYAALDSQRDELDQGLQRAAPHLRANNVLVAYRHLAGVERALVSVSRRLSHPNPLGHAAQALADDDGGLRDDFHELLPDLVRFARLEAPRLRGG